MDNYSEDERKLKEQVNLLKERVTDSHDTVDFSPEQSDSTISEQLNDLWQLSERCLDELEWTSPEAEKLHEQQADKSIVDSMYRRCQEIRENMHVIFSVLSQL